MSKKQFSIEELMSNSVAVQRHDSYETAPNYGNNVQSLKLVAAHIVANGMTSGKPSVDLQFKDPDGNDFVVMTSGAIIESLTRVLVDS